MAKLWLEPEIVLVVHLKAQKIRRRRERQQPSCSLSGKPLKYCVMNSRARLHPSLGNFPFEMGKEGE